MRQSVCPNCGAAVAADDSFCTECGTPLGAPVLAPQPTCPACGAPIEPGAAFCTDCGTPLGAPEASPQPTCPACGAPLEPGAAFCVDCGTPVGSVMPPSPSMPDAGALGGSGTMLVADRVPKHAAPSPQMTGEPHAMDGGHAAAAFPEAVPAEAGPAAGRETVLVAGAEPARDGMSADDVDWGGSASSRGRAATPNSERPHVITMDNGMTLGVEDDLSVRQRLLMLTQQEALTGCRKMVDVDGTRLEVNIPAGIGEGSKLDVEGWGYIDGMTGARGPLRLSIIVM